MKRYFITGTDTDCGKTYVSCRLLDNFRQQGHRAQALKPVASGGDDDVLRLQEHNYNPKLKICQWSYELPIAPHIAAQQAGEELSASKIAQFCDSKAFKDFDHLLIEGAGGLMVPLNEQETWLDFLKLAKIPVILVVGMRVGCINHALLTASELENHRIEVLGWIANQIDKDMLFFDENIAYLKQKMPMPLMMSIAFNQRGLRDSH